MATALLDYQVNERGRERALTRELQIASEAAASNAKSMPKLAVQTWGLAVLRANTLGPI